MIRRRRRVQPVVPVASMGDIAFLLIIFFMLTSNFMKNRAIDLDEASSPDIDTVKKTQVTVTLDKEGVLRLQGETCHEGMLESGVAALVKDVEDKRVVLKIDKNLTKEKYLPVFMALSRAGAKIALVGDREEE
jgi:biopolymer transport protein ExbD